MGIVMIKKSERDSNMELLRIIAMLLVMVLHADFASLSVPTSEECHNSFLTSFSRFYVEGISVVAVNSFVLLSGWYGIKPTINKIIGFLFQTLFLIFLIYFFFFYVGKGVSHSTGEWFKIAFFNQYWFVQCYIILFAFSPILNAFVEKCNKLTFILILSSLFVIQTLYGFLPYASIYGWYNDGYSPLTFFFLYLLARFLRIHGSFLNRFSLYHYIMGWMIIAFVVAILAYLTIYLGHGGYFIMYLYGYSSPMIIIGSLMLLLAFSQLKIKSRIINWIAVSSFSAYIVHCHECVFSSLYKSQIMMWFSVNQPFLFVLKSTCFIALLFMISILIDKCRMQMWKFLVLFYKEMI